MKTEDEQNYSNNNVLVKRDEKVHSETKTENYNQNLVCYNVGENIFEESSKQSLIWLISGFVSLLVVCAVAVSIVSKRKKQTK